MNALFQDEVTSAKAAYDEVVAGAGIEVVAPAEPPPAETMSTNPPSASEASAEGFFYCYPFIAPVSTPCVKYFCRNG
jgi:hypothetical protein